MKISLTTNVVKQVLAVGDVAVCENGTYLIIHEPQQPFAYGILDLKTSKKVNSFRELNKTIGTTVCVNSGRIIEIIKAKDLIISRNQQPQHQQYDF